MLHQRLLDLREQQEPSASTITAILKSQQMIDVRPEAGGHLYGRF